MTIGMALVIALDYKQEGRGKQVLIAAAILFGCLTAYTRVILGVHSIDQVVFGLSIGVWFAFAFEYQFKRNIYALMDNLDSRGIKINFFGAFVAVTT
jgi:membrane-associated phospholipid phosphatase